jgi:PST family polysaccharide transporter
MQRLRAWVSERPLIRQVLGNASWLAADSILRLGLGVVITAWTARHFGPAQFGLLNLAQAIVWLAATVANLGLEAVIVRDLVRMPNRGPEILASALVLRVCSSLMGLVACVASIALLRPDDGAAGQIVGILALGLLPQALEIVDYRYQATMHSRPVILVRSSAFAVFAGVRCLVILGEGGLRDIAIALTAEALVTGVLLAYLGRWDGRFLRPSSATVAEAARLLRECWPLAISGIAVGIYMRIDQLMLSQLADDRALGLFSAAVRVSEAWYFVPMALMVSIAPVLAASYVSSQATYRDRLERFGRSIVRLAIGVALFLSLLAPQLTQLVYGPAYAESAAVLVIHAWTGVLVCLGVVGSDWLLNAGLTRFSMYQTLTGAAVNVLLNLWLIPAYGAVGAAVATLAGFIVSDFLVYAIPAATRPMFLLQLRVFRWS